MRVWNVSRKPPTDMAGLLAFTLTELVTVIVLLGILSAFVAPRFANITAFSARTYFDEVISDIRYAQKLAVATGCDVQVSGSSTQIILRFRDNCTPGQGFNTDVRDPAFGGSTFVKNAPEGVTISTSDLPFYFDRLGRAHESGGAVQGASLQINSRNIQVVGETGFAYEP